MLQSVYTTDLRDVNKSGATRSEAEQPAAVRRTRSRVRGRGVGKSFIAARSVVEPEVPVAYAARATLVPVTNASVVLSVLIAAPTLEAGAADEGAVELARMLTAAGHRAIVVSGGGPLEPQVTACGAELVLLDLASRNPLMIARNAVVLRRIIAERRCCVVHALARAPAWSALPACRLADVPLVTTWYNAYRDQNLLKRLYNSVMARGERVIALSDQIADAITERYRDAAVRIVVAPPHVDFTWFDPPRVTPERIEAVRAAWGIAEGTHVIVVTGRILRRKGHHVVVRAARRLKDIGLRDFAFAFVGEDHGRSSYSGHLWDLVLATRTSDVIRIVGKPADAPAAYGAAVAVISASIQLEGPQRSLLEAMAMARPVIASDLAAGPEMVLAPPAVPEDRITGFRFRSGDDGELATSLIRLLSVPESTRAAMGRRGRDRVLTQFANYARPNQMLDIYAEIARCPK